MGTASDDRRGGRRSRIRAGRTRWRARRPRGELLLRAAGDDDAAGARQAAAEAESCFRRALDIARAQNAKSFELRAALSLAQLLVKRGQPESARLLMQPVVDWFSEGAATGDLREARAFLAQLDSPRA